MGRPTLSFSSALLLLLVALSFVPGSASSSPYYYDILNAVAEGKDLYDELGVSPDADVADVKRAYRDLALKWHPDKHRSKAGHDKAAKLYAGITSAYKILSSSEGRQEYDFIRLRGLRNVPLMDRHYYRHAHRYGIPPHDPRWVFLSLLAIFTVLKYLAQLATFNYYMRAAKSHPRYKEWAKWHGDAAGERLKLIGGVKRPTWDSLLAVQVVMIPYHIFRLFRWLVLRVVLRRVEKIDRYALLQERLQLSDEELEALKQKEAQAQSDAKRRQRR